MSAFLVQLEIAMTLAFIVVSPLLLYKIIKYISPALFEHEKKAIFKALTLSSTLFILGCLFAYYCHDPPDIQVHVSVYHLARSHAVLFIG